MGRNSFQHYQSEYSSIKVTSSPHEPAEAAAPADATRSRSGRSAAASGGARATQTSTSPTAAALITAPLRPAAAEGLIYLSLYLPDAHHERAQPSRRRGGDHAGARGVRPGNCSPGGPEGGGWVLGSALNLGRGGRAAGGGAGGGGRRGRGRGVEGRGGGVVLDLPRKSGRRRQRGEVHREAAVRPRIPPR